MGTIDIIILACFLPAIILGIRDGLIRQLVAMAVVIGGILMSTRFSGAVGEWILGWFEVEPFWLKVISFAIVFIAVALVISIIGKLLEKVLDIAMLGWLNRLLGMVVALATAALLIGTVIYMIDSANNLMEFLPKEKIEQSRFYKPLLELIQRVFPIFKQLF